MAHTSENRFHLHADYFVKRPSWRRTFDLLEGEHKCLTAPEYLWLHPMEQPERQCDARDKLNAQLDRAQRVQRTQYTNFMRMARERWVSLIMKGGLNISDEITQMFGEETNEIENVDGANNSLEEFSTEVARDLVSYGVSYVFTDAETREFRSLAEEQAANARPYWQLINPLSFKDWQMGTDGAYSAFRFEYRIQLSRQSLMEEPVLAQFTTLATMTDEAYQLEVWHSSNKREHFTNHHPLCANEDSVHVDWKPFGEPVTIDALDVLPISTNRIQESCLEPGIAIALKIFNKQSELDNILHNQCYDRLFIFSDVENTILEEDGQPQSEEAKVIKMSVNSLVVLPREGAVQKIEPTNPEALHNSIREDKQDFVRVVFNQARTASSDSKAVESEDTQKEVKESLLTRIERLREKLLGIMNKALNDYAKFKGVDNFQADLQFAKSVTEADINEMINSVNKSMNLLQPYESVVKEITKKVVASFSLPNEEDLFKEIDETERPEPDEGASAVGATRQRLQGLVTQPRNGNGSPGGRRPGGSANRGGSREGA